MENLVVDCAYTMAEYPNTIVIKVDDEFYAIPSLGRETNNLSTFRKIPKETLQGKVLEEIAQYRYAAQELEKRKGFDLHFGRAISDKEFEDLKEELHLADDDISEPYETTRCAIYGKNTERKIKCVQIKVDDANSCVIEGKLRRKGINADNINVGIIEIRISESKLKDFRKSVGMSQSEFAYYFGLSVRNVQEWEQEKKLCPPYLLDLLERIWKLENK